MFKKKRSTTGKAISFIIFFTDSFNQRSSKCTAQGRKFLCTYRDVTFSKENIPDSKKRTPKSDYAGYSLATQVQRPRNIKKFRTIGKVGKFENKMSIAGGRPNLPHAPLTWDKGRGRWPPVCPRRWFIASFIGTKLRNGDATGLGWISVVMNLNHWRDKKNIL